MTNANATALLVGHIQPPISQLPTDQDGYFSALRNLLDGAREKGVQIVYLKVGFNRGYPELAADSSIRRELEPNSVFIDGFSNAVDERVAPLGSDVEIVSPGPDIFARSPLASVLRAKGITSIGVLGVSTGGIVNGVVVGAFSEGVDVVVLEDLCFEPGVDNADSIFSAFVRPWGAAIMTSDEWLAGIKAVGGTS